MKRRFSPRAPFAACALSAMVALGAPVANAATVVVVNLNGAGVGFNDTTPVAPVGGNPGTTVGQQRLIAFQYAADIWGARLKSSVPIRVGAQFSALSCTTNSAVLGSAGPTSVHQNFVGAPVANTWYVQAQANAHTGSDLSPAQNDISANFNSNIGTPGCLQSGGWYYGLDSNPPSGKTDFVTVLLHELGHGLGFLSLFDESTGAKFGGNNDAYMRNLEVHGASPPDLPSMTDAQRLAAITNNGNLHWTGANVQAASGVLTAGAVGTHVRMYAPTTYTQGSSVSHWDTALTPNQLMEPNYTGAQHVLGLELPMFRDLGWPLLETWSVAGTGNVNLDAFNDIFWRNTLDNSVALWTLNGASIASGPIIGGAPFEWKIVATGDFNGDGKRDLLWRNNVNGDVAMWLMNGTTVASGPGLGNVSLGWTIVGAGDLDGDGKADIVWRGPAGEVAVWFMNGASVLAGPIVGAAPLTWTIAGVGDFDGNARADILWRGPAGEVAIWFMSGATLVSGPVVAGAPLSWSIAGVGDFDGNGKSDILWRNSSGEMAMWLMNGAAIASGPSLGVIGNDWRIVGAADFSGDNKADILWRHDSGSTGYWAMNGATLVSAPILGAVP